MNLIELQQYISLRQGYRNFIFILLNPEMFTKKGMVRKDWLHKFYEQNNEAKEAISAPKAGASMFDLKDCEIDAYNPIPIITKTPHWY